MAGFPRQSITPRNRPKHGTINILSELEGSPSYLVAIEFLTQYIFDQLDVPNSQSICFAQLESLFASGIPTGGVAVEFTLADFSDLISQNCLDFDPCADLSTFPISFDLLAHIISHDFQPFLQTLGRLVDFSSAFKTYCATTSIASRTNQFKSTLIVPQLNNMVASCYSSGLEYIHKLGRDLSPSNPTHPTAPLGLFQHSLGQVLSLTTQLSQLSHLHNDPVISSSIQQLDHIYNSLKSLLPDPSSVSPSPPIDDSAISTSSSSKRRSRKKNP